MPEQPPLLVDDRKEEPTKVQEIQEPIGEKKQKIWLDWNTSKSDRKKRVKKKPTWKPKQRLKPVLEKPFRFITIPEKIPVLTKREKKPVLTKREKKPVLTIHKRNMYYQLVHFI